VQLRSSVSGLLTILVLSVVLLL